MSGLRPFAEQGEQGGIDWLMARVGMVTASRFKDVLDKQKSGKPGAKRGTYLMEVVIERLTGQPTAHYASAAMEHGTLMEPEARMAYEAHTGAIVEEAGFLRHPTLEGVGGSPDGLCGESGGFEAKCPFNSANHLFTWLDKMPEEHMAQVQGLMWITGRAWWDFVSYDPRMPEPLRLYVQRIPRDPAYIVTLEAEITVFLAEVAAMVKRLESAPAADQDAQPAAPPLAEPATAGADPIDKAVSKKGAAS